MFVTHCYQFHPDEKCDKNVMIAVCFVMVSCVPGVTFFVIVHLCHGKYTFHYHHANRDRAAWLSGLAALLRRTQSMFERNLASIKARLERAERSSLGPI
jgi:hypothetical protein